MKTKICAPRSTRNEIIYGTDNPNYCYKILPIEKFPWKNKSKGLRHKKCSPCRNRYDKKIYNKTPEAKERRRACLQKSSRNVRIQLKSKINEIKLNSPCVDCGGTFHPVAMDFDHVKGTKKYGISEMAGKRMPWDKIQKEIDKCELRCANCHRIKTYEEHQHAAINNPVLIKT